MQTPRFWYTHDIPWWVYLLMPISKLVYWFGKNRFKNKPRYTGKLPIICIGNATAGGTGKTPVAIHISQIIKSMGLRPAFLTRGYGGTIEHIHQVQPTDKADMVGDEALLLANHAPTFVSPNRINGANFINTQKSYDVIITDDGLQNHPDLHKDCVILVVDNQRGFGNEYLIPAGPLREPIHAALEKSHLIFVVANEEEVLNIPDICLESGRKIISLRKKPLTHGIDLGGENVIVFSGLGNNQQFFQTIKQTGACIIETIEFPDHHAYSDLLIQRLIKKAQLQAALLVTTEKDLVKINPKYYSYIIPFLITLDMCHQDTIYLEETIAALRKKSS